MGYFFYGHDSYPIEIEDRALTHLKVAVLTLLRAGKSVAFSFTRSAQDGSGRDTLWINPTTDVRFHFNGNRPCQVNEAWIRAIIATASTPTGLRLLSETEATKPAEVLNT